MRKIFWLLAAHTSFISISAYAQDAGTTQLNRIVIEAPAEASVAVGEEDLQRINPEDVQDLFASEPSISVGSSLPISQKIYVQGVEENNLAVSIDGSRQNNKIFHHNATTLIDPALLKAVSIEPALRLRMPVPARLPVRCSSRPWMPGICSQRAALSAVS